MPVVFENQCHEQVYLPRASEQHGTRSFAHQLYPSNGARHPVKTALSNVCCWALLTGWDLVMSGVQAVRKACAENKALD